MEEHTSQSTEGATEEAPQEEHAATEEQEQTPKLNVDHRSQLEKMSDEELAELFAKKEEAASFMEALQRSKADYENYRKRQERDRASFLKYANQDILKSLLNVMDNLVRAIQSAQDAEIEKNFYEGICLVQKELEKTMQDAGVKEIDSKGQPFNPNYHEAISQMPSAEHPEMTVLQEFDKGYLYHDRVLRPSKVIVSKKPDVPEEQNEESSEN